MLTESSTDHFAVLFKLLGLFSCYQKQAGGKYGAPHTKSLWSGEERNPLSKKQRTKKNPGVMMRKTVLLLMKKTMVHQQPAYFATHLLWNEVGKWFQCLVYKEWTHTTCSNHGDNQQYQCYFWTN